MCDVRKSAVRWVMLGLAAGMAAGALATARAQIGTSTTIHTNKQPQHARRETNASRQARIQRTIDETYSHRWEVFGGGGYLRWRSGQYTTPAKITPNAAISTTDRIIARK